MKPLAIDFAPPSLARSWYRLGPRGWGLLALGVLLCGAGAVIGAQMLARQKALDGQLAAVRAAMNAPAAAAAASAAKTAAPPPLPVSAAQAAAVNGAILQLNLPWRELQDAVAAATPRTIALVALEPDPRKQVLKITAEAQSSDDMVDYVAELKQQETFSTVALTRHDVQEADPHRPLRFQLEATWVTR